MRKIRDSVVLSRIYDDNCQCEYLNAVRYDGQADNDIGRTVIEKSGYTIRRINISDSFMSKYNLINIEGSEGFIELDGVEYEASVEEIRILKALALEQCCRNADYSQAVAGLYTILAKSIINGTHKPAWPQFDEEVPILIREVVASLVNIINNKLGGMGVG